jgi:hypothetical protein
MNRAAKPVYHQLVNGNLADRLHEALSKYVGLSTLIGLRIRPDNRKHQHLPWVRAALPGGRETQPDHVAERREIAR